MARRADQRFQSALDAIQTSSSQPTAPVSWLEGVLKKRVIVHTRDDQSIEGVLMEQTVDGLILRAAKLLRDSGEPTSIAGETWIPRENVAFAQLDE